MRVISKKVDRQGRITFPPDWKDKEVILIFYDDKIEIIPKDTGISKFIGKMDIDATEWNNIPKDGER